MPLPVPITISTQLKMLLDVLQPWAKERDGSAKIIANQRHMWEELVNLPAVPAAPRILIMFSGEISRGSFAESGRWHRVDRTWEIVVVRGRGFSNLNDPMSGGAYQPFTDSLEAIRDVIRVILNLSEEFPLVYTSMKPLSSVMPSKEADAYMDGTVLSFSTANDIPEVLLENPVQPEE
jgi:hypothetical protein